MRRNAIIIILFSVLVTRPSYCEFSKVGTSAAQFLKIGVGARAMGMGESFVAVANDVTTMYWNPAGLTNLKSIAIAASHTEWFAEIYHDYAGLIIPLGPSNAMGLSATALHTNEQEVTTVQQPDGTGIFYNVSDIALGLSYALALTDRFSSGFSVKYIQQNAYNETAQTVAFDLGTYLRTGYHGLTIAMCMSNFGGRLKLEGRDLITLTDLDKDIAGNYNTDARLKTESWPLPLNFRVGVAMDIMGNNESFMSSENNRLTLAFDGNHPNDNSERLNLGGEYSWKETLFVRLGYKINYDVEKWAYGAGLRLFLGRQIMNLDYALVDFGDLGMVNRFSIGLGF